MGKVLFLGTDLHSAPTELASKTVRNLQPIVRDSHILSIQNVKSYESQDSITIIPRISKLRKIRLISQSILLPLYLISYRLKGYDTLATFWTVNNKYHLALFKLLKLLKFNLIFTVISGNDKNYSALRYCDKIIVQSENMKRFLSKRFPNKKIELIFPGVDLKIFKPSSSKKINLAVLSVPYSPKDFHLRGIDIVLEFLELNPEISSTIVTRSSVSSKEIESRIGKNTSVINRALSDIELADILSKTFVVPLLYDDQPDMPLSAIEALASGCTIICKSGMGISEFIRKNKCGIVSNKLKREDLTKLSKKSYSQRSRKLAEKYFSLESMRKKYLKILSGKSL